MVARNYYAKPAFYYPTTYGSVYPSASQYDFYRPNQPQIFAPTNQQGDESGLDFFRSGLEPRFFGLKKHLLTSLRGPPGNRTRFSYLYLLFSV